MNEKNVVIYYIADFLATLSYTLPHSILTVLLLAKGISLSDIIIIQSAYSLALVLFEFPSGVLADTWSKKKLYILSKIILVIMFSVVWVTKGFTPLYIAWFLYGIAAAFESGTLDTYLINSLKQEKQDKQISHFISISNRLEMVGMFVGSILGGILYFYIGVNIYLLSILFVSFSLTVTLVFFRDDSQIRSLVSIQFIDIFKHIKQSFRELKDNSVLRIIVLFNLFSQLFFQAHYQLWQSFFLFKGVEAKKFVIFYTIFQIISIIAYSINIEKLFLNAKYYRYLVPIFFVLPICFLSTDFLWYGIVYLFYVFIFCVVEFILKFKFNQLVSIENISSLVSLQSTITRLGGIVILNIISLLLRYIRVDMVLILFFILSLSCMFTTLWYISNKKNS